MVELSPQQLAYDLTESLFTKNIIIRDCEVILRGGEKSNFYIDFKSSAMTSPEILNAINYELHKQLTTMFFQRPIQLVGKGLSGAIMVTSLLSFAPYIFKGIIIRPEVKSHGYVSQIVGDINPTAPIVILDDVVTTGGTIKEIASFLPRKPDCAFVLVRRNSIDHVEGVPVYSLFEVKELDTN